MTANKIFFDLYSTGTYGGTREAYREWYDKNDTVYIILVDAKIGVAVRRSEMFDKYMHNGTFIEHRSYESPTLVKEAFAKMFKAIGCRMVSVNEFIEIEQENQNERVARAFAEAERIIAEG